MIKGLGAHHEQSFQLTQKTNHKRSHANKFSMSQNYRIRSSDEIIADRKQVIDSFRAKAPYLDTSGLEGRPTTPDPHAPELASKRNWEKHFRAWKQTHRQLAASSHTELGGIIKAFGSPWRKHHEYKAIDLLVASSGSEDGHHNPAAGITFAYEHAASMDYASVDVDGDRDPDADADEDYAREPSEASSVAQRK